MYIVKQGGAEAIERKLGQLVYIAKQGVAEVQDTVHSGILTSLRVTTYQDLASHLPLPSDGTMHNPLNLIPTVSVVR